MPLNGPVCRWRTGERDPRGDASYGAVMRTTIDLPDDLYRTAVSIARDRQQTLSRTVADLLRQAIIPARARETLPIDPDTGFPLVRVRARVSDVDVARAVQD